MVGRAATALVRCADPAMQPFHAVIDHQPDGTVWCTPLSARPPVRLGNDPVSGAVRWDDGDLLEIGGSMLQLRRVGDADSADRADAGVAGSLALLGDAVVRRPRAVPSWQPAELTPPSPPTTHVDAPGGLVVTSLELPRGTEGGLGSLEDRRFHGLDEDLPVDALFLGNLIDDVAQASIEPGIGCCH